MACVTDIARPHNLRDELYSGPAQDLVPVCPNYHAMIHRQNPPLSIDAVLTALLCDS